MSKRIEKERIYFEVPICQVISSTLRIKAESLEEAVELAKRVSANIGNTWVDDGELGEENSPEYIAAYIRLKYPELNKEDIQKELQDD